VRHSGGTFTTKADAQRALSQIETDIRRGNWINPRAGSLTLNEYASQWMSHRVDLAVRTRELYEFLLTKNIGPALGRIELGKLTSSAIRNWNSELSSRLPSSAAKSYRLLSTILRTAVADGHISSSPCTVRGASVERAPERPIASVQEVALLARAMPERLRCLVLMATWCQLRRGELLALRRCDLNFAEGNVTIERSRTFGRDGKSIIKGPKTRAGRREIAIPASLIQVFEQHVDRFCTSESESLLFTGEKGGPLTAGVLQKAWSKARETIQRPDLHFHDLRHSGLTMAAETGATTAELMHRAGHSSADASLRYQHASRERDRILAQSLETKIVSGTFNDLFI